MARQEKSLNRHTILSLAALIFRTRALSRNFTVTQ